MSLSDPSLWSPTSVQVTVLQARGLRIKGKSGTNDAYAIMQVGKEKYATSVVEKSVAPVWKEEAAFDLPPLHQRAAERCALHVHVLHRALVGPDKLLGQTTVNLLQLSEDQTRNKTEWFKLLDKAGKSEKDRGEVLVDIQFMRNNMTASMFDLSAAGKQRSRLGKLKDKVRGKKKEGLSDTASSVVPSVNQILTDSEEEGNGDGHDGEAAGKDDKKKKKKQKLKSLFSAKSNLQRNMSQSMSVLPAKNSSLSGSSSSGLNVDSSEGKKKFKFMIHKRSGSSDSKDSQGSLSSKRSSSSAAEQSNMCINGSHVYCEERQPRTSRIGSAFSLSSSGRGSMEDLQSGQIHEGSIASTDSLRTMRQYSPWTEEEEDGSKIAEEEEEETAGVEKMKMEEDEKRDVVGEEEIKGLSKRGKIRQDEEEMRRIEEAVEEERRRREEEEERVRKEEENLRFSEKRRLEEQERIRMEEEQVQEEIRRRQEEEDSIRRQEEEQERLAKERRKLEEQERRRIEEERLETERRRQEEEEERVWIQEQERVRLEEKRMLEEEERRRMEEEEKIKNEQESIRLEEERRRQEEEERVRREKEEYERLVEEKRRQEEYERRIIEQEEKIRREEEEKIRMEEERAEEEERVWRQEQERERLAEQKRKLEEQEKMRIEEEEKIQREEEERLRIEEERIEEERRRREEEDRVEREKEEMERLVEEWRRVAEQQKRIAEEENIKRMEEERAEEEERARKENERVTEEKRRREEEVEVRRKEEERLRMEEKKAVKERKEEEDREFTSTNPFEEVSDDPFEEDLKSPAEAVQQRYHATVPLVVSKDVGVKPTTYPDEKDHINTNTEREKRPAPRPPPVNQPESQKEQNGSTPNLAQSKDKDVKSASVSPQRLVQVIAPLNRSAPTPKNVQNPESQSVTDPEHLPSTTGTSVKYNKGTAPTKPRSSHDGGKASSQSGQASDGDKVFTSVPRGSGSAVKQVPVVFGLNPFEDDETENQLADQEGISGNAKGVNSHSQRSRASAKGMLDGAAAVPQIPDKDAVALSKVKSSKIAHAPLPPAKRASTSSISMVQNTNQDCVLDVTGVSVPDNSEAQRCEATNSESVQKTSPQVVLLPSKGQTVTAESGEEAGGKREKPRLSTRRLLPVKPLNPLDEQSVNDVQVGRDTKSSRMVGVDLHEVNGGGQKRPYSQLTQQELISLVQKQEKQLSDRDRKISQLEQYIDNLLVRVMEEKPSILMSLGSLKC